MTVRKLSRREFVQATGASAGVLMLGLAVPGLRAAAADPASDPAAAAAAVVDFNPNVFVSFLSDGTVQIVVSRSEMGQGVRTSLPRILADELEADLDRVVLVQATGDSRYGDQNTDGSKSVRLMFTPLRQAGATARMMLEQAAAETWGVPLNQVRARHHRVEHKRSDQRLDYRQLLRQAAGLELPAEPTLKHPSRFRFIGKSAAGVDRAAIVTGQAVYGFDVKLPGMQYACVARAPVFDARVRDYRADEALKIAGVRSFYRIPFSPHPREFRPEEGVAVVADSSWAAIRGRDALQVDWDLGANARYNTESFRAALKESAARPGTVHLARGDIAVGLDGPGLLMEAVYETPLLAHASMEPPVATAWVRDNGDCELWVPAQDAQDTRRLVAEWLDIDPSRVIVNITLLGGAFGRKSQIDFILEAVETSRQAGTPVQLLWTREDDIRNDYFHAETVQQMTARLGPRGLPTGWRMRAAYPSIDWMWEPGLNEPMPWELGMGWTNMPFDVPNLSIEGCTAGIPIRIGWLRSVCNVWHAFALNSFVDEMASMAQQDAVFYRLLLLGQDRVFAAPNEPREPLESFNGMDVDTGRYRRVLEYVAVKAGWGKPLPNGHFRGIAAHNSFYSYTASVVEIALQDDGGFRVVAVDTAVDCGRIINPEGVVQQVEGATLFGLGLALYGELSVADGRVQQSNFHDYRVLRMPESPDAIRAHLIDSDLAPSGIGEPPTPVIAPALAAALYAATGHRFRRMPFLPEWERLRQASA